MSDSSPTSSGFLPPPPPLQPGDQAAFVEFIAAFDKPLTRDEKYAWLAEVGYRILHGQLPQDIYPLLRDKIESLPDAVPYPGRPEEKVPGSDYVHDGPPKPYKPTTTVFPDATPMHVYEKRRTVRHRGPNSSFSFLLSVLLFVAFCFVAYGVGTWTMRKTKINDPTGTPLATTDEKPVTPAPENPPPQDSPQQTRLIETASDFDATGPDFGPELLNCTDFKNGYVPDGKIWGSWLSDALKNAVTFSNPGDVLIIDKRSDDRWGPTIHKGVNHVKPGAYYRIEYEARCNTPEAEFDVQIVMGTSPYANEGLDASVKPGTEWKTRAETFRYKGDGPYTSLQFMLRSRGIFEFRRVSVREVLNPEMREAASTVE